MKNIKTQMKKLSPQQAKTINQICSLKEDHSGTKNFWVMISEKHITLSEQKSGEERKNHITIPKKDFNKLLKWYQKPQTTAKR